ncbi:MAG: ABC transporter ATP-binding protein [Thermoplasmata archaeon]|jgi:ABC-2 type transport system ATP-binding protein|nr:ABC transporter ATP-binding protein [Thermoplasmata archaeon]MVT13620.1 ATP-binding cassette domain-containing protein [Euryarchaeota archaeon]
MKINAIKLTKNYEGRNLALDNVSFEVSMNGILAIIGKNGAGKTTLVRILATELLPTSGAAYINDIDVIHNAKDVRELIAVVPQEARAVPWLTPLQTVSSYLMWRGLSYRESRERGKEVLRTLGLENVENEKNRKLSGGMKRKVLVATVISSDAPIIFLDEPTTGLDYISRKELWEILNSMKYNRLIILTTHYLEEAEVLGDKIGILDKGKLLAFGSMDELRRIVKYPFIIKISGDVKINSIDGYIKRLSNGDVQIFSTEREIFKLAQELLEGKIKFTVQEVSLNNIFEFLVEGGVED